MSEYVQEAKLYSREELEEMKKNGWVEVQDDEQRLYIVKAVAGG